MTISKNTMFGSHNNLFFLQSEGEVERPRLKTSESISLAEDIYKKEEQVSNEIKAEWCLM